VRDVLGRSQGLGGVRGKRTVVSGAGGEKEKKFFPLPSQKIRMFWSQPGDIYNKRERSEKGKNERGKDWMCRTGGMLAMGRKSLRSSSLNGRPLPCPYTTKKAGGNWVRKKKGSAGFIKGEGGGLPPSLLGNKERGSA